MIEISSKQMDLVLLNEGHKPSFIVTAKIRSFDLIPIFSIEVCVICTWRAWLLGGVTSCGVCGVGGGGRWMCGAWPLWVEVAA